MTEYRHLNATDRDVALLHVLFVPLIPTTAGASYGSALASASSVDHTEIRFSYYDSGRHLSVQASPVTIVKDRTVSAGGRSFDLANGNVFVADVAVDGRVKLRQILKTLDRKETSDDEVMSVIRMACRSAVGDQPQLR